MAEDLALVGDIGGTNARFALVTADSQELKNIQVVPCRDYDNLDNAVSDYLARSGMGPVSRVCVAVACPVQGEQIKLTNAHWAFEKRDMQGRLGVDVFKVINDFTAMALGVRHVGTEHRVQLGGGQADAKRPVLVMGPGTGLGVGGLVPTLHDWVPLATEGGHVGLAACDEREHGILHQLQARYGRVSAERVLCGEGLVNIYNALRIRDGLEPVECEAADITGDAASGENARAAETLDVFFGWLGRVAGDAALTLGAMGGVYLCGGILPRVLEALTQSRFRQCFEDKGRMSRLLEPVPVWVVTDPYTGLLGAQAALDNAEVR